jgi:hypothetical protein
MLYTSSSFFFLAISTNEFCELILWSHIFFASFSTHLLTPSDVSLSPKFAILSGKVVWERPNEAQSHRIEKSLRFGICKLRFPITSRFSILLCYVESISNWNMLWTSRTTLWCILVGCSYALNIFSLCACGYAITAASSHTNCLTECP